MPSRIDIGPEGGPFVELDEENGDLVIRVPNDQIDFANSDIVNVGDIAGIADDPHDNTQHSETFLANGENFDGQGTSSLTNLAAVETDALNNADATTAAEGEVLQKGPSGTDLVFAEGGLEKKVAAEEITEDGTLPFTLNFATTVKYVELYFHGDAPNPTEMQVNGFAGTYNWTELRAGTDSSGSAAEIAPSASSSRSYAHRANIYSYQGKSVPRFSYTSEGRTRSYTGGADDTTPGGGIDSLTLQDAGGANPEFAFTAIGYALGANL